MVFGIIILIVILGVAMIHFVQGFFSATISAILAMISAAVALGVHENVVNALKGKLGDSCTAFALCSQFAITYVVLRMLFDRLVPGNMRFISGIDKAGGAIMGLVAGIIAAGILAIAAQTMPFGPSVFGYSRYALLDPSRKDVSFQADPARSKIGRDVFDELKTAEVGKGAFEEKDKQTMLVPADDIVLSLFKTMSNGSLSGHRTFDSVHADYLQEAFGLRIGMETPARRTAVNIENNETITVDLIAWRDHLKQVEDSELPEIRGKKEPKGGQPVDNTPHDEAKIAKNELKATGKQVILIVRTLFEAKAFDEKSEYFRFTPASIRLVTHIRREGDPEGRTIAKDYHPIGTMDKWGGGGGTLWPNRIDDPLFAATGADLVFLIDDREEVLEGAAPEAPKKGAAPAAKPAAAAQIKSGVFLEVKRLARIDLSDRPVATDLQPDAKAEVLRKMRMKAVPKPT